MLHLRVATTPQVGNIGGLTASPCAAGDLTEFGACDKRMTIGRKATCVVQATLEKEGVAAAV